ncbi:MAG: methyltransferase domain-containing protein [Actinomycetota bacterium]|nr:methyltransferase domain-containing protein [Actinomycetota bacterium]
MSSDATRDHWAEWVLARGHATDEAQRAKKLKDLAPIRDRVLANARIQPGDVVLDVGAGDGLIAFAALELVGSGRVIFSDISQDLLDHDRELALGLGVAERAEFVRATAQDLSPIPSGSVDVVTTRSVLIYVEDKDRAFLEFHRVLRGGGRVSVFEPINNYFPEDPDDFWGFDARPVRDLVEKISAYEGRNSSQEEDPMMNFTERDLLRHAVDAGFTEVHVELAVDVEPGSWVLDWDRLLALAPNLNAPTAGETIRETLTSEEAERFEAHLRPLVDSGRGVRRSAFAYLRAGKL